MVRCLTLLTLLLSSLVPDLRAQWEIFAQRIPVDGSWATYRVTTLGEAGQSDRIGEIRVSSRDGTVVEGVPSVWLEVQPVKWLGSRNKGRLSFLIPRAMDREKAARLLEVSREILFTDPVKGPWYLFPEDVRDLVELVDLSNTWSWSPLGQEEAKDGQGKARACEKESLTGRLALDPPLVRASVTTFAGTVWRDPSTPFGVVRAEWTSTERKGDETEVERKRIELLDCGVDTTKPPPIEHGERFTYWRLIRR